MATKAQAASGSQGNGTAILQQLTCRGGDEKGELTGPESGPWPSFF